MEILFKNPIRSDSAGAGHFEAPRGSRLHTGIDFECIPGALVCSPVSGQVTKIGYPYAVGYGDWNENEGEGEPYRYIEVTDKLGRFHRLLYVLPLDNIVVGVRVRLLQEIAVAQDVSLRYPGQGMKPHVHYEVFTGDKEKYYNPLSL